MRLACGRWRFEVRVWREPLMEWVCTECGRIEDALATMTAPDARWCYRSGNGRHVLFHRVRLIRATTRL